MTLEGFALENYRKTSGRQGDAFSATLTYNHKPVATYEDYADGGIPKIHFDESGHGQKELTELLTKIDNAFPIAYLKKNRIESCADSLCMILDEGRDFDQSFSAAKKKASENQYIVLILTGGCWQLAPESDSCEPGSLYTMLLKPGIEDNETASNRAGALICRQLVQREYKSCLGFMVLNSDRTVPLNLSLTEYLEIYDKPSRNMVHGMRRRKGARDS